jgi:uncharacterized alkaline shock family protein YloU
VSAPDRPNRPASPGGANTASTSGGGGLEFSEDIFASIACRELAAEPGIRESERVSSDDVAAGINKGRPPKGVKIEIGPDEVAIWVTVTVEYGLAIREVADGVRSRIGDEIKKMTGMTVRSVNLYVDKVLPAKKRADDDA